jgi:hypothetical protein
MPFTPFHMHADLRPLAPFSETNARLYALSVDPLHVVCLASGALGTLVGWAILAQRRGARRRPCYTCWR